jgi:hypothetical protein
MWQVHTEAHGREKPRALLTAVVVNTTADVNELDGSATVSLGDDHYRSRGVIAGHRDYGDSALPFLHRRWPATLTTL